MSAQFAREAEEEVRRCVAAYRDALWDHVTRGARVDHAALGFWRFPVIMVGGKDGAGSVTICDAATFDARILASYRNYYRDGWDGRVEVDRARATVAGDSVAVVENAGSRYRADGSVNSSWSCQYLLQRTARGWKHVGMDAAVPSRKPGDWARWLSLMV